jgi:hypothetical protein
MHTMLWLSMGLAITVILLDCLSIRWLAQRVKNAAIVGEG